MLETAKAPVADRLLGSIVGLAIGSSYPAGLGEGLGDEAVLALAIATSLTEHDCELAPGDIRARFEAEAEHWILTDDFGEACSTLGYLAPITMSVAPNSLAIGNAVALAEATDECADCIDVVRYLAVLLSAAQWAPGHDQVEPAKLKRELLDPGQHFSAWGLDGHWWDERVERLCKLPWLADDGDDLGDADETIDPLEAALWALDTTDSFEAGLKLAASAGEYLSLRCAIYGQLAGAIYGYDAIPGEWRSALVEEEQLRGAAEMLAGDALRKIEHAQAAGGEG
jgi:hypothetical protein